MPPPQGKAHALGHFLIQKVLVVPHGQLAVPAPKFYNQKLVLNLERISLFTRRQQPQRLRFTRVGSEGLGEGARSEVAEGRGWG